MAVITLGCTKHRRSYTRNDDSRNKAPTSRANTTTCDRRLNDEPKIPTAGAVVVAITAYQRFGFAEVASQGDI